MALGRAFVCHKSFIVLGLDRCVGEGFCVDIVFLDLAKAFDKVPT